jgi:hypothetical protein
MVTTLSANGRATVAVKRKVMANIPSSGPYVITGNGNIFGINCIKNE